VEGFIALALMSLTGCCRQQGKVVRALARNTPAGLPINSIKSATQKTATILSLPADLLATARALKLNLSRELEMHFAISEPALYCLSCVSRFSVKAELGLRSVRVYDVYQLLEQQEVACDRSHACPDEDAIEPLLFQLVLNNCLRSFAKIGQAHLHVIAAVSQACFSGFKAGQYLRRIHARVSCVVGVRKIHQCWLYANHQYAFFVCHIFLQVFGA